MSKNDDSLYLVYFLNAKSYFTLSIIFFGMMDVTTKLSKQILNELIVWQSFELRLAVDVQITIYYRITEI